MNIPFFNYPAVYLKYKNDFQKALDDIGSKGAFIMQDDLLQFEKKVAKYSNCNFAVGVGNATDALEMLICLSDIDKNDEVIISTHTMIATAGAIVEIGAVPVPVDIGKDHLMNYDLLEKNITTKTKAIMPTQLNGRTCNMDKIYNIAKKFDLMIFEDAAQGLGSKFKGKNAGTFGIASAVSFYPAKNLGCLGDGGAILLNDENLYNKIIAYRDHGRDPNTGTVISWGVNSRLDNLQASFLNYFLNNYSNVIERRRFIADSYCQLLGNVDEIDLPPAPNESADHFDVFQNFEIRAYKRDQLRQYLIEKGIGTLIQWSGKAIHHHKNLGFNSSLSVADEYFNKILMIPMNMFISDSDVERIAEEIKNFYSNK